MSDEWTPVNTANGVYYWNQTTGMTTQIGQLPPGRGVESHIVQEPVIIQQQPQVVEQIHIVQASPNVQAVQSGRYKLNQEELAWRQAQKATVADNISTLITVEAQEFPKVTQVEGTKEVIIQASVDAQPVRSGPYKLSQQELRDFHIEDDVRPLFSLPTNPSKFFWPYEGKTVQFAGDLNNWQPEPMQKTSQGWKITKNIQDFKGKQVKYKFVVDGNWYFDEAQPTTNDEERNNIRQL